MWYAITARPIKQTKKEKKKEFYASQAEIFLSGETKYELQEKINSTIKNYPKHSEKYLSAGLKIVKADNPREAKLKAQYEPYFTESNGQISFY